MTNFTAKWKETTVNKLYESYIIQLRARVQDCAFFHRSTIAYYGLKRNNSEEILKNFMIAMIKTVQFTT